MMSNPPVYSISGLNKEFQGRPSLFTDFNLRVEEGELLIIYGRSGSGKSTLLNILLGFEQWDSGQVLYRGRSLKSILEENPGNYYAQIGYMSQFNLLVPELTIIENITTRLYDNDSWKDRIRQSMDVLKELKIDHLYDAYPYQVSGGELRRANLAFALVNKPGVLLLDEPTSNLHTKLANEVFNLICEISEKHSITTLLVTHDQTLSNERCRILEIEREHKNEPDIGG